MKELAILAGGKFHHGIVLYTGEETVSFGSNLTAMPISALTVVLGTKKSSMVKYILLDIRNNPCQ